MGCECGCGCGTQAPKGEVINIESMLEYAPGAIVSKIVLENDSGTITTFAFTEGQKLSVHSAPFDALVQILDGEAEIELDGKINLVSKGDIIIMPANVPHGVKAVKNFKMLLTMIKG
jgi:quercetin dioxygenase-like cupin family protein